tara:strand:- start:253 stop:570 length:318 start_codon:yes stop_codon:yes gene_type:complete
MRHEQYMKDKLSQDEEKLMDEFYTQNMTDKKADMVNSPSHYNQSGIECIAAIQAALGPNFKYYLQGNIMKYLWRFDYKGKPLEDLQKAQWYLNTLLEDVVASDES